MIIYDPSGKKVTADKQQIPVLIEAGFTLQGPKAEGPKAEGPKAEGPKAEGPKAAK